MLATLSIATVAALSACSFSSVDPDAEVHVSGRALDAAGKPLTNTKVLLLKQADIGEVVFGTVLAIGTLSTICLLPDAPAICDKARTATTDGDGRYTFDLKGEDTQGTLGTASTLNVVFSGPKAQGSTTVSFTAKEADIDLPDARLWKSDAKVSGAIRLSWTPLPSAAGSKRSYSAQLFEANGRSALWSQPASGRRATIDPRILEDQRGSVAVGASSSLEGGSGGGKVRASYLSPRIPVRPSAGEPASRGRRCAAVTGTAPARDAAFSRCAATDGELASPARLAAPDGTLVDGVAIDLGSPRRVDLVVVRGFAGQLLVETSADGKTFSTVATSSGSTAVEVPGSPRARYLRVRSPAGLDESLLAEVSVWG